MPDLDLLQVVGQVREDLVDLIQRPAQLGRELGAAGRLESVQQFLAVLASKLAPLLEVAWIGRMGVGVQRGDGGCGQGATVVLLQGDRPADSGDQFIPRDSNPW